jgi:hypothetical protein
MENFSAPPTGLMLVVGLLLILPGAFAVFVPLAIFRSAARKHLASWSRERAWVAPGAYRGAPIVIATRPRIPFAVAVASVASLFVAVPLVVVAPVAIRDGMTLVAERRVGWEIFTVLASVVMASSAVVGRTLLKPSREAAVAARVLATGEILLAHVLVIVVLAFSMVCVGEDAAAARGQAVLMCAAFAVAHALVLFAGATANDRANVRGWS